MSDHEVEGMVELPSLQELAWQSGGEETVNDGTVSELSVGGLYVYLCRIRSNESFGGQCASFGKRRHVQKPEELIERRFLLIGASDEQKPRRLRQSLLKGSWALEAAKCGDLMHDGSAPGRLTKHCDPRWISTEKVDTVLDPLKGKSLIVQSCIGGAVRLESRARKKTKGAKSVIQRDKDNPIWICYLTGFDETGGAVAGLFTISVSSSVDPNQDWRTLAWLLLRAGSIENAPRNDNIKEEAILRGSGVDGRKAGWNFASVLGSNTPKGDRLRAYPSNAAVIDFV